MEKKSSPSRPWRLGNRLTTHMMSVSVSHFLSFDFLLHLAAACLAALSSEEIEEELDDGDDDKGLGESDAAEYDALGDGEAAEDAALSDGEAIDNVNEDLGDGVGTEDDA